MPSQKPYLHVVPRLQPRNGVFPPRDLRSEAVVICDLIERPENVPAVRDILVPDDFTEDPNRFVYEAIVALDDQHAVIDQATIAAWLRDRGRFERVGGLGYFARIIDATPMSLNVMAHVTIVHNKGRQRRMIAMCQACQAEGYGDIGEDTQQWLDSCNSRVSDMAQDGRPADGEMIEAAIDRAIAIINAADGRKGLTGAHTGIKTLDNATAGLQKPELVIITGQTGKGKTALALNMAYTIAGNKQDVERGVHIFSLEMASESLSLRMAASSARVDLNRYRMGQLTIDDFRELNRSADWIRALPIKVDDQKSLTPAEIRGRAIRYRDELAKKGIVLRLVIVDYIQLVDGCKELGGKSTREEGTDYTAKKLVELAKELNVTVLALAQLNNEGRIRNSRAVEHAADTWLDIERQDPEKDKYASVNPRNGAQSATIVVRKQRNGPDDQDAPCWWYGGYLLFADSENL